ncbi:hypothetical protein HHK36_022472 [Tetracentron sinense]|uniref:EF-hand domain-containing protein n=1 Tax=Tetracentron sinense TaxID=13715 RepID=A0A834YS06_TETSI|nr:hypothetical protein HHK36_022472 [Tetracentron sinense]
MEEIRGAALAYYEAGSEKLKKLAKKFFESLDKNGDGTVSIGEFAEFIRKRGYIFVDSSFFKDLDKNGDGSLDFEEVITFYYMLKTRTFCHECGNFLRVLYFTCVKCFHKSSYDLCTTCYSNRKFKHKHKVFLDNYALLLTKRDGRSLLEVDEKKEVATVIRISLGGFIGQYSAMAPDSIAEIPVIFTPKVMVSLALAVRDDREQGKNGKISREIENFLKTINGTSIRSWIRFQSSSANTPFPLSSASKEDYRQSNTVQQDISKKKKIDSKPLSVEG